jgi:transposase
LYVKSQNKEAKERMLKMEEKIDIRSAFFEHGKTISEISRDTGRDRKTVRGIINREDWNIPPPTADSSDVCPKLDPFKSIINEWLEEDKKAKKKQRHTSKRVYDRLRKEDATKDTFDCSYESVNKYVRKRKKDIFGERPEGYIPLTHAAGEAQADFGTAEYIEAGNRKEGKYLNMSFPYSNQGYQQLFPGENAECLFEGMKNIFMHISGVPREIWFDNASTMVTDIIKGGGRKITGKFERFSAHYGFKAIFCNPNAGNEKGSVENKVGYHRRNMLVPMPKFKSLDEFNKELLGMCDEDADREHYRLNADISELFCDDKAALIPLPKTEFDTAAHITVKTDKYAIFTIDKYHEYSTSPKFALSKVRVKLTAQTVTVMDDEFRDIVVHPRLYGEAHTRSMMWIPYLEQLSRKPRAVKYSGVYEMFPENVRQYIAKSSGGDISEIMRMIAELTEKSGWELAVETISRAVDYQAYDADSLLALHRRMHMNVPELPPVDLPKEVPDVAQFTPDLSVYDTFIKNGGDTCARI